MYNSSMKRTRVLFVLKDRNLSYGIAYGLSNSCQFVANALEKCGIVTKIVSVVDGNAIDKEVHFYKPTHVIIEALYATPHKMRELLQKYPKIQWTVRIHSKTPFIANEGIAIDWIRDYFQIAKRYKNFSISANNIDIMSHFKLDFDLKMDYLPNIYCPDDYRKSFRNYDGRNTLKIGVFGSIRPLKNQLMQCVAGIALANQIGMNLECHINSSRMEQGGGPILKNMRNLFKNTRHTLVEHDWMKHEDFIKLVREMDIVTQISFSESFCIVAADAVWNGIPVVGSDEIDWLHRKSHAKTTDIRDILYRMKLALTSPFLTTVNKKRLDKYNRMALNSWLKWLKQY